MLSDDEIQALIVQYNKEYAGMRSDRAERERRLNTWCSLKEFITLRHIITELSSAGFNDFRCDDGKLENCSGFILCNYGPLVCRIDISVIGEAQQSPDYRWYANLTHLRSNFRWTTNYEGNSVRSIRPHVIELACWEYLPAPVGGGVVRTTRPLRVDKLLVGQ